jgi:hypothetical protein
METWWLWVNSIFISLILHSFTQSCKKLFLWMWTYSDLLQNWLSSAHSSLQHLDQIKASVYNVGIHDPNHLKATNLSSRSQRSQSFSNLVADPNAPPLSLQKNAIAW